jgi:hypothetical protein
VGDDREESDDELEPEQWAPGPPPAPRPYKHPWLRPRPRLRDVLAKAEPMLGLGFAAFLAFVILVGGAFSLLYVLLYSRALSRPLLSLLGVAWAALAVFEWRSVALIAQGLERASTPVPISIALHQPVRTALLRPIVCAWWLANAAALVVLAHVLVDGFSLPHPSPRERIFQRATAFTILFASAFASNMYILLAATAVTRSARIVSNVWRWRFVLDIAVAVAGFWVNRYLAG